MHVLVAGTRSADNSKYPSFCRVMDEIKPSTIIEGGASGIDAFARRYASERDITLLTFKADWSRFGKGAGPIRNTAMVDFIKLKDQKIALVVPSSSSVGTFDTKKKAIAAGINVIEMHYDDL